MTKQTKWQRKYMLNLKLILAPEKEKGKLAK